ncbi:MAG: hypothetical protein P8J27_03735 [Mariniblastus sp.]|nr:hypothetical protein [Mariniblastus sp.]
MSDFVTKVKTVNSAIRTLMVMGVAGAIGYGGWFGYDQYIKPGAEAKQAIADLEALKTKFQENKEALKQTNVALEQTNVALAVSKRDNERLETSMKLLKIKRRVANLTVMEKGKDPEGSPYMEVSFTEIDEQGEPVGSTRIYTVKGEKLYVDGWIASFEDKYIEQADELRSASMFIFKSIYGDQEKPSEGQSLDQASANGGAPGIYKSADKREFEEKIWADFWKLSNDLNLQKDLGISAIHGMAGYIKPQEGKTYQVHMKANGAMSLNPIEEP